MRVTSQIVIILILLNAMAGIMQSSGISEDWGIAPSTGGEEAIERANESTQDIQASGGIVSTLFGLFTTLARVAVDIFALAFAAPTMMNNLGVPSWFTIPASTVLYFIAAFDIYYLLSGRDI